MVLLHYKKSDHNQFLVEVQGASAITDVVAMVV
jgi:hypothetical protein